MRFVIIRIDADGAVTGAFGSFEDFNAAIQRAHEMSGAMYEDANRNQRYYEYIVTELTEVK